MAGEAVKGVARREIAQGGRELITFVRTRKDALNWAYACGVQLLPPQLRSEMGAHHLAGIWRTSPQSPFCAGGLGGGGVK